MIQELVDSNCVKIGNFKLKNGETSKYYFDIKNVISNPKLLSKIGDEIYKQLDDFDIICGIPYGGLPLATYISTKYNKPLIYFRDKKKKYGTQKLIEGQFKSTDRCVILDDVITTGGSIDESIEILKDKVNIQEIVVVLDRTNNSTKFNYKSLFKKDDIIKFLDKI